MISNDNFIRFFNFCGRKTPVELIIKDENYNNRCHRFTTIGELPLSLLDDECFKVVSYVYSMTLSGGAYAVISAIPLKDNRKEVIK